VIAATAPQPKKVILDQDAYPEAARDAGVEGDIAFDLAIAETTVKAHVTAIMRKLGVQSRTQAVLIAREASFASLMPENG
jgi:hypothetical protein